MAPELTRCLTAPIKRVRGIRTLPATQPIPHPIAKQPAILRFDILRDVLDRPAEFARSIKTIGLSEHKTELILGLLRRSEVLLIDDIRANWCIKYTGRQPLEHDYHIIPDWLLPSATTIEELEQYIADFRKERTGVIPQRILEGEFTDRVCLEHPSITHFSTISVELMPEVVQIEDGKLEITFDRVKKVRVTITN